MVKIIFVGLPNAGKTTLKKIFFEGADPEVLLEKGLEPTRGFETIIINLEKLPYAKINMDVKITYFGIFDFGGQEIDVWLETERDMVFKDAKSIIFVVDATTNRDKIHSITKKILNIRKEMCPDANIFLLIHKIDLVNHLEIDDLKNSLHALYDKEKNFKIEPTSITKDYFALTTSVFTSLLKTTLK